jgi:hypothetical protein
VSENPYQPPAAHADAPPALAPPPPEEPLATFESNNRKLAIDKRWLVRVYPRGLHVAPGLGQLGYWLSREQFLERGELMLGALNAMVVPLAKKTVIPIDKEARLALRRWLHPDEQHLVARAVAKQRWWLLGIGALWVWGALPTARHPFDALGLVAGVTAVATALVGLYRPVRQVFLGEVVWIGLWMTTMARQIVAGGNVAVRVVFLLLAVAWLATSLAQFRFYAPLEDAAK